MSKLFKCEVSWEDYKKLEKRIAELEGQMDIPHVYSSTLYHDIYERTTTLWAKFSRLYQYLGVEDVVNPEVREVRKSKNHGRGR